MLTQNELAELKMKLQQAARLSSENRANSPSEGGAIVEAKETRPETKPNLLVRLINWIVG